MRRLPVLAFVALTSIAIASAQMPPPPVVPAPPAPAEPAPSPVPPVPPTPPVPLPLPPPPANEPPAMPVAPTQPLAGPASIDNLLAALPGVVTRYDAKTEQNGTVVLNGLTISAKKPDGTFDDANKITIGRVELDGFDADAVQLVFDASRYTGVPSDEFRLLASHIVLENLALTVKGKSILTMASASYDGLQMKQLPFVPGGANFEAQFKSPQLSAVQVFGGLMDSLKSGPGKISGLHFEFDNADIMKMYPPGTLPPGAAENAGSVSYDVQELSGESFDRGVLGKIGYRGLTTKSTIPNLGVLEQAVDSASFNGMDVSKVLPWMIKAEWPPITRDGLISIGPSSIDGFHIKLPGIGSLDVPHANMDPIAFVWLIPEHFKFEVDGTFTPAPAGEFEAPPYVAKYFTQPMDAGFVVEGAYDPDAGTASFVHYGFHLGTFGSFDMAGTMGGLKLETLSALPLSYQQVLSFVSGSITLVDQGGVAKILDMSAASSTATSGVSVTPETLQAQAKGGVDMMVGALGNSPAAAAFGKAFKDFIDQGGRLVVGSHPPTPLHYADMMALMNQGPNAIMTGFGLSADHAAQ